MYDLIRSSPQFKYLVVGLIVIPLGFFGANYLAGGTGDAVILVGSSEISREEYRYRYRVALDEMRSRGADVDNMAPETERAFRSRLVSELVSMLLYREAVNRKRLVATDDEVRDLILGYEEFQDEGEFSREVFDSLVTDENAFVGQVRAQARESQFDGVFRGAGVVSERSLAWYLAFQLQERTVSVVDFPLDDFRAEVSATDEEIQEHYTENPELVPERGQVEYFVYSLDGFSQDREVSDEEVGLAYEDLQAAAAEDEQRRASHILLESAAADEARARLAGLAAQAAGDPGRFAELAAEHSEDPGSSSVGGDLGFVLRGDLEPSLDDALFALGVGEVSEPVESEAGVHLLMVTEIRPGFPVGSREEMDGELRAEIRRDKAAEDFDLQIEQINERLFVESAGLGRIAHENGLEVKRTDWLAKGEDAAENPPPFDQADVLAEVFTAESREGINTALIPFGDDEFVAARMFRYEPERIKALDEVREEIGERVVTGKALDKARDEILETIESLREGEDPGVDWGESRVVNLLLDEEEAEDSALTAEDLDTIRRTDLSEGLPAYTVAAGDDSIRLIRIEGVETVAPTAEDHDSVRDEIRGLRGRMEQIGYLEELRGDLAIDVRRHELN